MIYFIRDSASGHVKIGFSEKPYSRLSKMQSDCPGELAIVGLLDGGEAVERKFHDRFADCHVRGEWFREDGDLAAFVAALPVPPPQLSARRRQAMTDAGWRGDGVPLTKRERENSIARRLIAAGLGRSHAYQLVRHNVTIPTCVRILRRTGVRLPLIEDATEAEIAVLEKFGERADSAPKRKAA